VSTARRRWPHWSTLLLVVLAIWAMPRLLPHLGALVGYRTRAVIAPQFSVQTLTGDTLSMQSLRGKVVAGVAEAALAGATPTVVIAGQALVGRREAMSLGISGTYAVADNPGQVAAALADPVGTLVARAAQVALTWSPRHG